MTLPIAALNFSIAHGSVQPLCPQHTIHLQHFAASADPMQPPECPAPKMLRDVVEPNLLPQHWLHFLICTCRFFPLMHQGGCWAMWGQEQGMPARLQSHPRNLNISWTQQVMQQPPLGCLWNEVQSSWHMPKCSGSSVCQEQDRLNL